MKNPFKVARALYSLAALVRDPDKLGQVFELASALGDPKTLKPIVEAIREDDVGGQALAEKRRLRVDLAALSKLPLGTLGRVFADEMTRQGLTPDALPDLETPDDASFVRAHFYDTHDVWHAVTGFGTTWPEEIGLQAFYLAQVPGPLPALLLTVGAARVALFEMSARENVMDAVARGWTLGKRSKKLFGQRWDLLWDKPLADVRTDLGLAA